MPSLRLRLALAGAIAVTVALALAALGLSSLFAAHVQRLAGAELSVQLDQLVAGLDAGANGLEVTTPPADPRFDLPLGGRYWEVAGLRSRSLWDEALVLPDGLAADGALHLHRVAAGPGGQPLLVAERTVTLPARLGGARVRAAVAMDATELAAARGDFLRDLTPALVVLALVLTAAGVVQVTVGLRPLQAVGARVLAVRQGARQRIGADVPAEVRPLAAEVDALLSAREVELERARRRAADLAHALKTPLQALLGEAARLRPAAPEEAAAIEDLATAMERHVTRELTRARMAASAAGARADLGAVVAPVVRVLTRTPDGARLDWQLALPAGLVVACDPADLTEALGALLENAARHARSRVAIAAAAEAEAVTLTIRDDGPGIPEAERAAMQARGGRSDSGGSGLGLAIAGEVLTAMGGTLDLGDAAPGLVTTLRMPRAITQA